MTWQWTIITAVSIVTGAVVLVDFVHFFRENYYKDRAARFEKAYRRAVDVLPAAERHAITPYGQDND